MDRNRYGDRILLVIHSDDETRFIVASFSDTVLLKQELQETGCSA